MAHTPGPWTMKQRNWRNEPVEFDWYISGDFHENDDENDDEEGGGYQTSVCIVPGNATAGTIPEDTARLIIAAPDLLAALVFIRDYARDSRTGRMLTGEGYAMAEAAIAKAKPPA